MRNQGVAQTLLDHYRDSLSPSQQTRERMLREVLLRVTGGSTPSVELDAATELVQPGAAGGANPLVAAAVAAGATALLAVGALWWRERPDEPRPAIPDAPSAAPVRAPETLEPAAPVAEASEPEAEIAAAPPVKASRRSVQNTSPRPTPRARGGLSAVAPAGPPPAAKPATDDPKPLAAPQPRSVAPNAAEQDELVEELRLIRAAYAALQADKPEVALARVDEHSARFPHGKLAESRDLARIMALCQSGEIAQGRVQIARFLADSPGSAYTSRVKTLCK